MEGSEWGSFLLRKGASAKEAFETAAKHTKEGWHFDMTEWAAEGNGREAFKEFAASSGAKLRMVEGYGGRLRPYVLEMTAPGVMEGAVRLEVHKKDLLVFNKFLSDAVNIHLISRRTQEIARDPSQSTSVRDLASSTYALGATVEQVSAEQESLKRKLEEVEKQVVTNSKHIATIHLDFYRRLDKLQADAELEADQRRVSILRLESTIERLRRVCSEQSSDAQECVDLTEEEECEETQEEDASRCFVCLEQVDAEAPYAVLCCNADHRIHNICCRGLLSFAGSDAGDGFHVLPRHVTCGYCRQRRDEDPFSPLCSLVDEDPPDENEEGTALTIECFKKYLTELGADAEAIKSATVVYEEEGIEKLDEGIMSAITESLFS